MCVRGTDCPIGVCHYDTLDSSTRDIPARMTHWSRMGSFCTPALALLLVMTMTAPAQTADSDFKLYTEHPRLLLNQKRLRLLRRERQRESMRWMQFDTFMKGKAAMPEPAFASALYAQITEDATHCRTAIEHAARPATDVRQVALAYDWCEASLTDTQRSQLKGRLERALKEPPPTTFSAARDRTFAAVVLADAATLSQIVNQWWRKTTAPALVAGSRRLEHADIYPFLEIAHAIRDNLQIDVRDDILPVFKDLALRRLLSYYPAGWPAPENDYRIPYFSGKGEPDLKLASLTRASEFALVAFESNAQEMQFLQGWLLLDRFVLKSPFGAPYELLWANPYQPGLPFEKLPLSLHEPRTGTILIRSSWEEDATWLGFMDGSAQLFRDGQIRSAPLRDPLVIGDAMLLAGPPTEREFRVAASAPGVWYLIGLKPSTNFDVEVDDEEMFDITSDRGGIAKLDFTRKSGQAVYFHEPRKAPPTTNH